MTLGIIGTGLIGGAIGMRMRDAGWRVIGFDVDARAAEEALQRGAIDEIVERETVHADADVIVIAAHVSGTLQELRRMRCTQRIRARLILDVSSVKAPIVAAARGIRNFVATHPMAGRERSGPAAADRDMFEGKPWLYVSSGDREDRRAVQFIGALGAVPVEIQAEEHDRIIARSSHLPQVLATLFASRLERSNGRDAGVYVGPAARESDSSKPFERRNVVRHHRFEPGQYFTRTALAGR